ncbi:hypothetical protein PRK78_002497 [Emydomyces testavorans]|uniref:EKC/KEOPS complex subunit GON7 n=1 Tax=Emydomyces testavorans TaxID=2070801 RepID=A0AAF0DEY5_9EURO|nr:hypothetical protein PRK78_002497 [Emydomyces testavorans]
MAPPPNTPANNPSTLNAFYLAPASSSSSSSSSDPAQREPPLQHTIQHQLSTSLSSHTADATLLKAAYLSELRGAVTALQSEINALVEGRDESREEENYGEEVVDEEEEEED